MGEKTLRELAKEFAKGAINKEEYRKARGGLIKGILSGEIPLQVNEYPPPIMPPEPEPITETRPRTKAKSEPTSIPAAPQPDVQPAAERPWLLIATVVAILCLAILLIILLRPSATQQAATGTVSVTPPPVTPAKAVSEVEHMIEEFLIQKNWGNSRLQAFQNQWGQLSQEEKDAGNESTAMRRLTDAIYRQLLEEQALADISKSTAAVEKQHNLVDFAEAIGIYDARIKIREVPVTITQAPQRELPAPSVSEEANAQVADNPVTLLPGNNRTLDDNDIQAISADADVTIAGPEGSVLPIQSGISELQPAMVAAKAPETMTGAIVAELPDEATALTGTNQPPDETAHTQSQTIESVTTETVAMAAPTRTTTKKKAGGCRTSLAENRKPYCRDQIEGAGKGPTMVVLPSGKFVMGGEETWEQPSREVTIATPFAMSVHEVTFNEFEQFCTATGHSCPQQPWSGGDYPVVNITWKDAVNYTEWMSERTGKKYRLPSEAEWEYAARGGTTTIYPSGDKILITDAVFSDRKQLTAPLPKTDRSINRNKFRLYHMVGNVREWVADSWQEGYSGAPGNGDARITSGTNLRVVRGGAYRDSARALRSGARQKMNADSADKFTGFRIMQELVEEEG